MARPLSAVGKSLGLDISKKAVMDIVEGKAREDAAYARTLAMSGHWTLARIHALSTDEMESRLRACGIPYSREVFAADLRRLLSSERVSDAWWRECKLTLEGMDSDFPFMAALELQRRLFPEIATSEVLDEWMQEGYALEAGQKEVEAADVWWRVWRALLERLPRKGIRAAEGDEWIHGSQCLFNWTQDFLELLHNAGLRDRSQWERRLMYCREFVDWFGGAADLLRYFLEAEATTLFSLGRDAEGEEAYRRLVDAYPDWEWGYASWGDEYCVWERSRARWDFAKAESIYRLGLRRCDLPRGNDLEGRLRDLYEQWGKEPPADVLPAKSGVRSWAGTSRNAACPCGSGKKFKRCCGK